MDLDFSSHQRWKDCRGALHCFNIIAGWKWSEERPYDGVSDWDVMMCATYSGDEFAANESSASI